MRFFIPDIANYASKINLKKSGKNRNNIEKYDLLLLGEVNDTG